MTEAADYLIFAILIGDGATPFLDLSSVARKKLLGTPPPDYGLVGRWVLHMTRGRFHHDAIAASPVVPGERTRSPLCCSPSGASSGYASRRSCRR